MKKLVVTSEDWTYWTQNFLWKNSGPCKNWLYKAGHHRDRVHNNWSQLYCFKLLYIRVGIRSQKPISKADQPEIFIMLLMRKFFFKKVYWCKILRSGPCPCQWFSTFVKPRTKKNLKHDCCVIVEFFAFFLGKFCRMKVKTKKRLSFGGSFFCSTCFYRYF